MSGSMHRKNFGRNCLAQPEMPLKKTTLHYGADASALQLMRKETSLPLPSVLESSDLDLVSHEALGAYGDHEDIERLFPVTYGRPRVSLTPSASPTTGASRPLRIGAVLSGGQAPGGHNVIAGIFDYIKKINADSVLIGFLDGPHGVYSGNYAELDEDIINHYRNSGGFNMIGSGRHKIEKEADFASSLENCAALDLDGVVIIGGDDSNTNAAVLAEYFEAHGCKTKVCGCPKTIDGDLKVDPYIPISFGFDTACKTYSELVGNLCQDTLSSQKYYHFVRLMGRAASNIALECALITRPNVCLISEEIQAEKKTLAQITHELVQVIVERWRLGKNYGVVLLPEGLIEFIPEFTVLIEEINDVLYSGVAHTEVHTKLTDNSRAVFEYLPELIKEQLLLDRDPHGNVQVTKIETERLLAQTVSMELEKLRESSAYGGSFAPQYHSYGYEGRSCLPSMFDATYCYALGQNVAALIAKGQNGLISSVTNLTAPVRDWACGGVPITMMCHMEKRHAHMKPVINKALVELEGEPFKCFKSFRDTWSKFDLYRSPGPIQFFHESGNVELCITLTLELMKVDERMSPATIEAAVAQQSATKSFGSFLHAPIVGEASRQYSQLQYERACYKPELVPVFSNGGVQPAVTLAQATECRRPSDRRYLSTHFPLTYAARIAEISASSMSATATVRAPQRVGVVFCGRQAPGGHDVISGLLDSLPAGSTLIGFVGGATGLASNHHVVLTAETMRWYRGQGGFELLCRSSDKVHETMFADVLATCNALSLDGLVLAGGARTNTDAARLAEHVLRSGCSTSIISVPVDVSSSLKNEFVECTVGFDTSTRVSSQVVGNNATDGASAKKYYYFMRLMGDAPSHSTLEVALSTKPNFVILAEEVDVRHLSLSDIVHAIADMVVARANVGKNYGTVLMPEGLVESIPELKNLISEVDALYAGSNGASLDPVWVRSQLTLWSNAVLQSLPDFMQASLLLSRGSNNSIQLSQAQTERMLAHFVELELNYRKAKGTYKGSFSAICSYIGYQARGASPSNFDICYAYNLGHAATALIAAGLTGYIATINNLKAPVSQWRVSGVPIVAMFEQSDVTGVVAVQKTNVDLHGSAYAALTTMRETCIVQDQYENPGPLQFFGPASLTDGRPFTLQCQTSTYLADFQELKRRLEKVEEGCRPGCSSSLLRVTLKSLQALSDIVEVMQEHETKRLKRA